MLKLKAAYLKHFSLPLSQLPLFVSTHKKYNCQCDLSCSFCLPLALADNVLFFNSNKLRRRLRRVTIIRRCQFHTVRIHVVPKSIRSMLHSVICYWSYKIAEIIQSVESYNEKSYKSWVFLQLHSNTSRWHLYKWLIIHSTNSFKNADSFRN